MTRKQFQNATPFSLPNTLGVFKYVEGQGRQSSYIHKLDENHRWKQHCVITELSHDSVPMFLMLYGKFQKVNVCYEAMVEESELEVAV